MRTILILALTLAAAPAWAHCRHHCNNRNDYETSRRWTYQENSDGAWRYYEGQGGGWGDSFYGENGGTAHYGD